MAKRYYGWKRQAFDPRDQFRFVSSRALARLAATSDISGGMGPQLNQGNEGCHDDKTEVLTEKGWVLWPEYRGDLLLGTMNPQSGLLEFQAPSALHRYEHDGPMIYSDNRSLDMAVTTNHRMFVRPWIESRRTLSDDYQIVEAGKLGWYCGLPHATGGFAGIELKRVAIGGHEYAGNDFVSLLGLVVSDGWAGGAESTRERVGFCCFRADRQEAVRSLAARLGFREFPGRPGVWERSDIALADWFRQNAYTSDVYRAPFKRVPDVVRSVSQIQVDLFLNFFGDKYTHEKVRTFYSSSRRLIDDLQELLLRVGKRGSICQREPRDHQFPDGHEVRAEDGHTQFVLVDRTSDKLSIERKKQVVTEDYKGEVFCATVPNSLLVTRRNGSILVSGNSCGPNTIDELVYFLQKRQGLPAVGCSRLFTYYNTRALMGTVNEDSGVDNRTMLQSLSQFGFIPEPMDPYDDSAASMVRQPTAAMYATGLANLDADYAAVVQSLPQMKGILATTGKPFMFGFDCYPQIESDQAAANGILTDPGTGESPVGGHDISFVGYSDVEMPGVVAGNVWPAGYFKFRNHWMNDPSTPWGDGGYGYITYRYATNPAWSSDFWLLGSIPGSGPAPPPPPPPSPGTQAKATVFYDLGTKIWTIGGA